MADQLYIRIGQLLTSDDPAEHMVSIRGLTADILANPSEARIEEAIPAVIHSLIKFKDNPDICFAAFIFMTNTMTNFMRLLAVLDRDRVTNSHAAKYLEAHIPEIVVASLRANTDNLDLVVSAYELLANLTGSPRVGSRREGVEACLAAGAVPVLVGGIKNNLAQIRICALAGEVLDNIASTKEGEAACMAADAPPVLVAAIVTHAWQEQVFHRCCSAIAKISSSKEGLDACLSVGALDAVLKGMIYHRSSLKSTMYGCLALSRFTQNEQAQARCLEMVNTDFPRRGNITGPQILLDALTAHGISIGVAQYASKTIANIAKSEAGKAVFIANEARNVLRGLLFVQDKRTEAYSQIQETLALLDAAAASSPSGRTLHGTGGGGGGGGGGGPVSGTGGRRKRKQTRRNRRRSHKNRRR